MKNLLISGIIVLMLASCVVSKTDDDGTAEAEAALASNRTVKEKPDATETEKTKTAPSKDDKEPDIKPTDLICQSCVCKEKQVDCSNQDLDKFFTKSDWAGLVSKKPSEVDLSNNPLKTITYIVELPIQVLNLSRCEIASIEKASFKELQQMRVLDLSYNKLTSEKLLPYVFEGRYSAEEYEPLSSMRVLNLAYNELHSLNQDLFEHMPELTELDISGNPFTTLDHVTLVAISSLPLLKVLKMRSCQLDDVPEKFLHTTRNLEHLDLSNNLLSAVPQELEETKNLIYLNLNQNPIIKLESSSDDYPGFPLLSKLQELHMCNMDKLESIDQGTLAGLQNLKKLHISFNSKLKYIHPKAMARVDDVGETYDWPPVRELYLRSNNLSEIDSRLISRWDLLEALDVSDNPYLCDCSTQWMVDILVKVVENYKTNASLNLVCQDPIEMRGLTMKEIHDKHSKMRCVDKYGNRPERDGAILLGTLIGVLLAVPIMLVIVLLWRRGYFAWCGVRGPADYSRAFYKRAQTDEFTS